MKIKSLEGTSTAEIVNTFNESFADYFTPFQLNQELLNSKMKADKTDLSLSVGVFDNEKLVAFILHGFDKIDDEKVVYNAGTGVIPTKRGQGLTRQMYQFVLPFLQERGVDFLTLEVITENIPAIRSYTKSGFKIDRKVLCFKGEISIASKNDQVEIRKIEDYDWDRMQSFWDATPTWQNSKHVLDSLKKDSNALGAYIEKRLVGYAIFNAENKRIHQIAVSQEFRKMNIASTLVEEILITCGNQLSIINVDEKSKSMHSFLETIGFENYLDQYEMKLALNS